MRSSLPVISLALLASSTAFADAPTCSAGEVVHVSLAELDRLVAAEHAKYTDGAWRLPPGSDGAEPGVNLKAAPSFLPIAKRFASTASDEPLSPAGFTSAFQVMDCSLTHAALSTEPGTSDVLITLDCESEASTVPFEGATFHTTVLLRSAGADGAWCRLDEISLNETTRGRPCIGDYDNVPQWKVTPVEAVAAGRHAFWLDRTLGSCGDGASRGNEVSRALYGVEGGKLVRYFDGVIDACEYSSPCPPTKATLGKLTLTGGFPKHLVHEVVITCEAEVESDCRSAEKCRASRKTTELAYSAGAYVPVKKSKRAK